MDERTDAIEFLAIGHLTADLQPDGEWVLGGAACYGAVTAAALGLRSAILTRAPAKLVECSELRGVAVWNKGARRATKFQNRYGPDGSRRQELVDEAPPLRPSDVPSALRRARILHVAPVMHEVAPEVVEMISADTVGVSAQGWARSAAADRRVQVGPLRVPAEVLRRTDVLFVSSEDLAAGPQAAAELAEVVRAVVVTQGASGARVMTEGREYFQPAVPASAVDPTGAGDVFAAAFLVRLTETDDITAALRFAASAAAFCVESLGLAGIVGREAIGRRA